MADRPAYYITTPIYYVNDVPHIGHMYTTLACDVLARFKRLDGFHVKFLTGTDEHGQKVDKAARLSGLDPQTFTDKVSENFRALARLMNFSNDDFIRTTEARHVHSCQALWQTLLANDQIYLGSYAGWYAVRDEAFYAEAELTTGPGGDKLAPSGAPVEWVEEPSYFFRLSQWQEPLLRLYADNPEFVLPRSRLNEVVSFVRGGLQDLSISRTTFQWGIPVPDDPAHVMYVWLDALTNYITAIGYPEVNTEDFQTFWPADVHMVGKDILRFHAVYWPAFLMAAGLAPPKRVFAHGWWTVEGQKMSKSLGNAIDPLHLIETYGRDQVRYVMLREVPFGNDGDFSHESVVGRINGELANDFGNLVQRVLSMVAKNCGGTVPTPGPQTGEDAELLTACNGLLPAVRDAMDRQAFHEALDAIWAVIRAANGYVDRQAPWALRKSDPDRMRTVLYVLMEAIRHLGILTQPFVPEAAGRILDQLAVGPDARSFAHLGDRHGLVAGTPVPAPTGVFPRHEVAAAAGEGTA
ncbi:MAG: methionine--tRNA ligase [Rhodospirillales bacterium]|nr:MAG: methionine--tRNA ligase [Rhodospirillales bacterium]